MKKTIYLDYAATTPIDPRVKKAMLPYLSRNFGNTMSLHSSGQKMSEIVENSRRTVADLMGAEGKEIIFTSSATESNNFALKGVAFANRDKGKNIIISPIEHPCILESAIWLQNQGFKITKLPVNKHGLVNPETLKKKITKETILVSVMHANNEIGTVEPTEAIGEICRERGVYFHTDAAQTFGKLPINVNKMNIDLLTASSHKMYGPTGVACLFIRDGTKIEPFLHGGGHEFGLRSATINVLAIVGFAKAVELCKKEMREEKKKLVRLRDKLIKGVLSKVKNAQLTGTPKKRLPNNASFRFSFIEGESLVLALDSYGIAASTGSACSSNKLKPSHVLLSLGLKPQEIHGSLRLSLGRWTQMEDINFVLEILPRTVNRLRRISPFKRKL